jgi:prepilin-type N-terminal cleavage/methylation domain-containing protein
MKSQKGFTLVELVIAAAITGLIVTSLGVAVQQTFTVTDSGNDRMLAMHELQNAARWVNHDGQMASTAISEDEPAKLSLTLPDDSSITYTVVGTELHRTAGESQMTLARNISSISFSVENRVITMTITSSPPGRANISEQGTYKVYLRPTEG